MAKSREEILAGKSSVILHSDWQYASFMLTTEEKALMWDYFMARASNTECPTLTPKVQVVLNCWMPQIIRDDEDYVKKCLRQHQNGSKGGRPKEK